MVLNEVLSQVKTVAVGGHIRPDGDCTGSCLGLYQYLRQNRADLKVDLYLEEIPEKFKFIKAHQEIRHRLTEEQKYDLFISLDCGDIDRLGFSEPLFRQAGKTLCIDHHASNHAFADRNYIFPEASSTSELVYGLLDAACIQKEVAECLFLGIVHDTGVFQYACTSPATMEAAAQLMKTGIDAAWMIEHTFYEKTYAQNQILGYTLMQSRLLLGGAVIASVITKKEMEVFGVHSADMEGIVSQLRITEGVEAAVFAYELKEGEYKVSLRSSDQADVSRIAQKFGGGGHKKAAGFSICGKKEEILEAVMTPLEQALQDLSENAEA